MGLRRRCCVGRAPGPHTTAHAGGGGGEPRWRSFGFARGGWAGLHFGRCGQAYRPRAGVLETRFWRHMVGVRGTVFEKRATVFRRRPVFRGAASRGRRARDAPLPARRTRKDSSYDSDGSRPAPPPLWGAARHDRRLDSSKRGMFRSRRVAVWGRGCNDRRRERTESAEPARTPP